MRAPGHGRGGPRAKLDKKSFATLMRVVGMLFVNYWYLLIIVGVCIVLSSLANTRGSMFLKELVDDYIVPLIGQKGADYGPLFRAIMVMGLIYLVGVVATFIQNWTMISVSQGMLKKIRSRVFDKLQSLPIKFFDTRSHGSIMSLFTNDVSTLRQLISQSIPQFVSSVVTVVIVFINMLRLSLWLTLVVCVFIAIMFILTGKIGGKSGRYYKKQQASLAEVNGFIEEMINGQKVVKVFCHEDAAKHDFDERNEELRTNATRANTYANVIMPLMNNLGNIQYVFLAIIGGALAVSGVSGLTIGTIIAFLQLSKQFSMPISQLSEQVNSIVLAMAGADRLFEVIDAEAEEDDGKVELVNAKYDQAGNLVECTERTETWAWKIPNEDGTFRYVQLRGDVCMKDVDFGYVEDKQVLFDVSIDAKRGEKVAFVGATGAGKTTITNLINRFYDIQDGSITYDGIDIKDIRKGSLRMSLGIVLQDVNLFTGTVRENIRYGRLDATDEEVVAAAKLANAHGFIEMLPQGYDTVLEGDGSGLSQGQRQLIAIARAAVADPPVMILDEATSSIDTRTETIVQNGMDSLMHGRTVFVIAHRLSTVMNSDNIMVLDHGHIIESGNHDKLIEEQGTYYRLYTGAFQLD